MTKVVFNTPLRSSDPRPRVEHAIYREYLIGQEINKRRYTLEMGYTCGYPAGSTRSKIVSNFLDGDGDYLIMLDDDQYPDFNVLDFVELDCDVLGFPYPSIRIMNENPIPWFPMEPQPDVGIAEVDQVGGGCMIIARRVLECHGMRGAFRDRYNEDGIFTNGEDLEFCDRARENGFSIMCDLSHPITHIKPVEMLTMWRFINE